MSTAIQQPFNANNATCRPFVFLVFHISHCFHRSSTWQKEIGTDENETSESSSENEEVVQQQHESSDVSSVDEAAVSCACVQYVNLSDSDIGAPSVRSHFR